MHDCNNDQDNINMMNCNDINDMKKIKERQEEGKKYTRAEDGRQ